MGLGDFAKQIPLAGSLFDDSQERGTDAINDARAQFSGLTLPELTWANYSPDQMTPEMAQASLVSSDPLIKSAQLSALSKMGDLANTGLSAVDQQGYEQARELGNQMANSGSSGGPSKCACKRCCRVRTRIRKPRNGKPARSSEISASGPSPSRGQCSSKSSIYSGLRISPWQYAKPRDRSQRAKRRDP
jgi:hypothetical protein